MRVPILVPESDCLPELAEPPAEPEETVQECLLPPEQAPAPEAPAGQAAAACNFRITDNSLGVIGGPKARYAANIAAIRLRGQACPAGVKQDPTVHPGAGLFGTARGNHIVIP